MPPSCSPATLTNDQLNLQRDEQLLASGYIAQSQVRSAADAGQKRRSRPRARRRRTLQSAITSQQVNGTTTTGLQAANVAAAAADARAARVDRPGARAGRDRFRPRSPRRRSSRRSTASSSTAISTPASIPARARSSPSSSWRTSTPSSTRRAPIRSPSRSARRSRSPWPANGPRLRRQGRRGARPGHARFDQLHRQGAGGKPRRQAAIGTCRSPRPRRCRPSAGSESRPPRSSTTRTPRVMIADDQLVDASPSWCTCTSSARDGKTLIVTGLKPATSRDRERPARRHRRSIARRTD